MKTIEDMESYLLRLNVPYDTIEEGLWIVNDDASGANIVIRHDPPVAVFRVKLMPVPEARKDELFRLMLELNATEMIGGAYGIEGDSIVAIETLQAENLDFNEFQAAVDGLMLAATEHFPKFKAFM